MVDTALVVDLLGLAIRKAAHRYVVMSDDDDMLPGLFAAEAAGARIGMLRRPGTSSFVTTGWKIPENRRPGQSPNGSIWSRGRSFWTRRPTTFRTAPGRFSGN